LTRARDVADSALVHIHTETFSAVSSASINDVFSSTYDNYLIQSNYITSAEAALLMRLRVGGSDNSSANYGIARFNFRTGSYSSAGSMTETYWNAGGSPITRRANATINLFDPFTSNNASMNSLSGNSNASYTYGDVAGGTLSVTTSYTGFTFFVSAGTLSGTFRVYGYRN